MAQNRPASLIGRRASDGRSPRRRRFVRSPYHGKPPGEAQGPGTIAFARSTYSVNEGGIAAVTVWRSGGLAGVVSATLSASGGTATSGEDYTGLPVSVSFSDGEYARTVLIPIASDEDNEGSETIALALSDLTGGASLGSPSTATLTIGDIDPPALVPGTLAFSTSSYAGLESAGTIAVTIIRSGGTNGEVSATLAVTGGTATEGEDFDDPGDVVVFADGESSVVVDLDVIDNDDEDGDQTVVLELSSPSGGASLGAQSTCTVTILDEDDLYSPETLPGKTLDLGLSAESILRQGTAFATVGGAQHFKKTSPAGFTFGPGRNFFAACWVQPYALAATDAERALISLYETAGNNRLATITQRNYDGVQRFIIKATVTGSGPTECIASTFGTPSTFAYYFVAAGYDAANGLLRIRVGNRSSSTAPAANTASMPGGIHAGSAPLMLGAFNISGAPASQFSGEFRGVCLAQPATLDATAFDDLFTMLRNDGVERDWASITDAERATLGAVSYYDFREAVSGAAMDAVGSNHLSPINGAATTLNTTVARWRNTANPDASFDRREQTAGPLQLAVDEPVRFAGDWITSPTDNPVTQSADFSLLLHLPGTIGRDQVVYHATGPDVESGEPGEMRLYIDIYGRVQIRHAATSGTAETTTGTRTLAPGDGIAVTKSGTALAINHNGGLDVTGLVDVGAIDALGTESIAAEVGGPFRYSGRLGRMLGTNQGLTAAQCMSLLGQINASTHATDATLLHEWSMETLARWSDVGSTVNAWDGEPVYKCGDFIAADTGSSRSTYKQCFDRLETTGATTGMSRTVAHTETVSSLPDWAVMARVPFTVDIAGEVGFHCISGADGSYIDPVRIDADGYPYVAAKTAGGSEVVVKCPVRLFDQHAVIGGAAISAVSSPDPVVRQECWLELAADDRRNLSVGDYVHVTGLGAPWDGFHCLHLCQHSLTGGPDRIAYLVDTQDDVGSIPATSGGVIYSSGHVQNMPYGAAPDAEAYPLEIPIEAPLTVKRDSANGVIRWAVGMLEIGTAPLGSLPLGPTGDVVESLGRPADDRIASPTTLLTYLATFAGTLTTSQEIAASVRLCGRINGGYTLTGRHVTVDFQYLPGVERANSGQVSCIAFVVDRATGQLIDRPTDSRTGDRPGVSRADIFAERLGDIGATEPGIFDIYFGYRDRRYDASGTANPENWIYLGLFATCYRYPAIGSIYVAASGSSGNPGTIGSPKQTLAQAIALGPRDTHIFLNGGDDFAPIDMQANTDGRFTVSSYGTGQATIEASLGGGKCFIFNNRVDVTFYDLIGHKPTGGHFVEHIGYAQNYMLEKITFIDDAAGANIENGWMVCCCWQGISMANASPGYYGVKVEGMRWCVCRSLELDVSIGSAHLWRNQSMYACYIAGVTHEPSTPDDLDSGNPGGWGNRWSNSRLTQENIHIGVMRASITSGVNNGLGLVCGSRNRITGFHAASLQVSGSSHIYIGGCRLRTGGIALLTADGDSAMRGDDRAVVEGNISVGTVTDGLGGILANPTTGAYRNVGGSAYPATGATLESPACSVAGTVDGFVVGSIEGYAYGGTLPLTREFVVDDVVVGNGANANLCVAKLTAGEHAIKTRATDSAGSPATDDGTSRTFDSEVIAA